MEKFNFLTQVPQINPIYAQSLINELNGVKCNYDKETTDYLKTIISLDVSILRNKDINSSLGDSILFRKIAAYNIVYRTMRIIGGLQGLEQDKIYGTFSRDYLEIVYRVGENKSFVIFKSLLGEIDPISYYKNSPFIHVIETNPAVAIDSMKSQMGSEEFKMQDDVFKYVSDALLGDWDMNLKRGQQELLGWVRVRKI